VNHDRGGIRLRNLSRRFGDVHAVKGLTFDIKAGELFGLVGPDGAGKTTTMRMIAGVLPASGGDALVSGVSVTTEPESVKHHIAYMSQRFGLYTDLTVSENISFYADLYQVPRKQRPQRLERLYAFSNLGPFADRLAGNLSGGMKQKLSLCCALIHHPDVLLLDEPTFGVDPISRRDLWLIIHQMVAEGVTVFLSTAYLDEAERCDRVALLNAGSVIALDTPQNVQATLDRRMMIVHTDQPRSARDLLRETPGVEHAALFGENNLVTLASPDSDWSDIERYLWDRGVDVRQSKRWTPTLEDAFIHLVTRSTN